MLLMHHTYVLLCHARYTGAAVFLRLLRAGHHADPDHAEPGLPPVPDRGARPLLQAARLRGVPHLWVS